MANPIFWSPDRAGFLLGVSLVEPPNMLWLQTCSLIFFEQQSTSAESIKKAPCLVSTSQSTILTISRVESFLIYTKASLVVSTVPASMSKKTATLPRTKEWSLKGITSCFPLVILKARHTQAEDQGKDGLIATLKRSQHLSSLGEQQQNKRGSAIV